MQRIWLARYPPGIPADVDVAAYRSIGAVFEMSAAKFGPRAAFVNMGTAISYSEMERLTRDFAAYLQGVLKLPRGARVALMMPTLSPAMSHRTTPPMTRETVGGRSSFSTESTGCWVK